jgi:hypothetical protein
MELKYEKCVKKYLYTLILLHYLVNICRLSGHHGTKEYEGKLKDRQMCRPIRYK